MDQRAEDQKPYCFRPYSSDDIPFIQNSWGNSYFLDSIYEYPETLTANEFHSHHRPIRERILNSPNTAVIICCATTDQALILGWLCVEKLPDSCPHILVHYLYVKSHFMRQGIAKELIQSIKATHIKLLYSHRTMDVKRILNRPISNKYKDFVYTPHLLGG